MNALTGGSPFAASRHFPPTSFEIQIRHSRVPARINGFEPPRTASDCRIPSFGLMTFHVSPRSLESRTYSPPNAIVFGLVTSITSGEYGSVYSVKLSWAYLTANDAPPSSDRATKVFPPHQKP